MAASANVTSCIIEVFTQLKCDRAPKACLVKQLQELRDRESRGGVSGFSVVCGRRGGEKRRRGPRGSAEQRSAVCVWTSRVRPHVNVETMALSEGCGLGVEHDGFEEVQSSVSDQG